MDFNRTEMMKELHGEKQKVYDAKNADYGDAFVKVRREYPMAIIIRLMDKLERLKTLYAGNEAQVSEETIEDTLLDMSNYAEMEIIERRVDRLKKREGMCRDEEDCKVQASVEEVMQPVSDAAAKDHAEHYWEHRG